MWTKIEPNKMLRMSLKGQCHEKSSLEASSEGLTKKEDHQYLIFFLLIIRVKEALCYATAGWRKIGNGTDTYTRYPLS
jgi:hypothetical protein